MLSRRFVVQFWSDVVVLAKNKFKSIAVAANLILDHLIDRQRVEAKRFKLSFDMCEANTTHRIGWKMPLKALHVSFERQRT